MPPPWQDDYTSLTTSCGAVKLTDWSQVQLTGGDRVKFLHNMCSNNIQALELGQLCEAFCTDVKGKILAHVLVIAATDRLLLLTVPGQAEKLIRHLDRYIIREDVQLTDVTADSTWYYCVGPQAAAALPASVDFKIPCDLLWPGGFLTRSEPRTCPIIPVTAPAVAALRIESSWPLYGTDFDDANLPQEINRDSQAISFTKGCYLGQETIARIDALGHVNKKLALAKFSGEQIPAAGTKLNSGEQEVGTVTSGTWSPAFAAPLALGFVKRGFNEPGTKLQSETDTGEIVAPWTHLR